MICVKPAVVGKPSIEIEKMIIVSLQKNLGMYVCFAVLTEVVGVCWSHFTSEQILASIFCMLRMILSAAIGHWLKIKQKRKYDWTQNSTLTFQSDSDYVCTWIIEISAIVKFSNMLIIFQQ